MRLSDDQLRELLDESRRDPGFEFAIETNSIRAIIEELLARRADERNADIKAAEMRRWNGEE